MLNKKMIADLFIRKSSEIDALLEAIVKIVVREEARLGYSKKLTRSYL